LIDTLIPILPQTDDLPQSAGYVEGRFPYPSRRMSKLAQAIAMSPSSHIQITAVRTTGRAGSDD
jgi:hypothetical protein